MKRYDMVLFMFLLLVNMYSLNYFILEEEFLMFMCIVFIVSVVSILGVDLLRDVLNERRMDILKGVYQLNEKINDKLKAVILKNKKIMNIVDELLILKTYNFKSNIKTITAFNYLYFCYKNSYMYRKMLLSVNKKMVLRFTLLKNLLSSDTKSSVSDFTGHVSMRELDLQVHLYSLKESAVDNNINNIVYLELLNKLDN